MHQNTLSDYGTDLLTDEEIEALQEGLPRQPPSGLVANLRDGRLRLTARGMQYYGVALRNVHLPLDPLQELDTQSKLEQFCLDLQWQRCEMAMAEARLALEKGDIPMRSREMLDAFLNGSFESFQKAVEKRLDCETAGPNVIPIGFGNRSKRKRSD